MRAAQCGHFCQKVMGHSSPPMWMYSEGKSSRTSASTPSMNSNVVSLPGQNTRSSISHVWRTSYCSPVQLSHGQEASAATACPGNSISGITVMPRSAA